MRQTPRKRAVESLRKLLADCGLTEGDNYYAVSLQMTLEELEADTKRLGCEQAWLVRRLVEQVVHRLVGHDGLTPNHEACAKARRLCAGPPEGNKEGPPCL
ncbi:MAG: hypothetical protein E6G97_18775 [Alphaproteobacteria bacterium]|nr:MAG: hypothetical protein E6G97_18775 [Alphaproteobacteria bacterium]